MPRNFGTRRDGSGFDQATINKVWLKGEVEPNYPSFRKDVCGASMQYAKYGKTEQFGWEIDHIKPITYGGTEDLENLQPLYWENNRSKSDSLLSTGWCKIRN